MIKVLHIVSSMNAGGVENIVYSYVHLMDKAAFQNDIACYTSENGVFRHKFEAIGMRVYKIPSKHNILSSFIYLYRLLKDNVYDIVHVHLDDQSFLALFAAMCAKVKVRIVHTHLGVYEDDKSKTLHTLMRSLSILFANQYFACSEKAADEFYPKKIKNVFIMRNGIDFKKYKYDELWRKQIREEYGLNDNDIVIGNVARLTDQKNPFFLIDVFNELKKQYKNIKMLLVGDGYLYQRIEKYISSNCLTDSIILTGAKDNAEKFYNAIDIFVLPSKFEGFGISFIESQANGITTIASNRVPKETCISDYILYLSIDSGKDLFVNTISKMIYGKKYTRRNCKPADKYDIYALEKRLEMEYLKYVN